MQNLGLTATNFEVQEEILVKAFVNGFSIVEVPFTYFPRGAGRSHAKLFSFGWKIFRSSIPQWKLRNSHASADYYERAFNSMVPPLRYWHRKRHHITVQWARGAGRVLDVGCGSSLSAQSLNNAIGMDRDFRKLRFLRRYQIPLVNGSALALPFKDASFDCVIASQLIERVPSDESIFSEMRRVLRTDGTLILGTPDFATIGWRTIEPIRNVLSPGRDGGKTQYTRDKLGEILGRHGIAIEETAYIAGSEMILRCRKAEIERRAEPSANAVASTAA